MDLYATRQCDGDPTPYRAFNEVPINYCVRTQIILGGNSFKISNCKIRGELAIDVYSDANCENQLDGGEIGYIGACADDSGCCPFQLPFDNDFDGKYDDAVNVFFSIDIY